MINPKKQQYSWRKDLNLTRQIIIVKAYIRD